MSTGLSEWDFAISPDGAIAENRSEYYLITSFNRVYKDQLEKLQAWKQGEESVQYIQVKSRNAFEGRRTCIAIPKGSGK